MAAGVPCVSLTLGVVKRQPAAHKAALPVYEREKQVAAGLPPCAEVAAGRAKRLAKIEEWRGRLEQARALAKQLAGGGAQAAAAAAVAPPQHERALQPERPTPQQQQQQQQQRDARASPAGADAAVQGPPPKRRRKQASPLRERPHEPQLRQDSEASPASTMLVEGAEEGAGSVIAMSMHGLPAAAAAETAAAAAVPAGVLETTSQGQPTSKRLRRQAVWTELQLRRRQAAAARRAEELQPPAQAQAGPDLLGLLEQAMDVAAAAASGLTSGLVGAFAALPPLEARQVHFAAVRVAVLAVLQPCAGVEHP